MPLRRAVAVVVAGPMVAWTVLLACAPKAPVAPDDGWSPKLGPVSAGAAVDAGRPKDAAVDLVAQLADASVEDLTEAIRQRTTVVGPHRWRIQRQAFDLLFVRDAELMARSFRLVAEMVDGATLGMRVFGVRQNGLGGLLGLLNGDRIEAVSGIPVARSDQAAAIFEALQHATHIELALVRASQPVTLTYDIVDP